MSDTPTNPLELLAEALKQSHLYMAQLVQDGTINVPQSMLASTVLGIVQAYLLDNFHNNGYPVDRDRFISLLTEGRITKWPDQEHATIGVDWNEQKPKYSTEDNIITPDFSKGKLH